MKKSRKNGLNAAVLPLVIALTAPTTIVTSSPAMAQVNTMTILQATFEQFVGCIEWSVSGMCMWWKCTFFSCQFETTIRYTNHAPELVGQAYHRGSSEPITESRVINDLPINNGSNSNWFVGMLLSIQGYWKSSLEGGVTTESAEARHTNTAFKNVDLYGHPFMFLTDWQSWVNPSEWPEMSSVGSIDISSYKPSLSDIWDIDDYDINNPPWEAVDESWLSFNLSDYSIMNLYGLVIEEVLPEGCDAEGVPTLVPNPNYGDTTSVCTGVPGYGGSCTNITDEFIPLNTDCSLDIIEPELPSWEQIKSDFSPAEIASASGQDVTDFLDVGDTLDMDDINELANEISLDGLVDYVFCSAEGLTPWYPYFMAHPDLVGWRFGITEMIYPETWAPLGVAELARFDGLGYNNYGPYYPRTGFVTQADQLKDASLAVFKASHITSRENQPHLYTTSLTKTDKKNGYWAPKPIEKDSGAKFAMVYPKMESGCSYLPYSDKVSTSWRSQEEAFVWNIWRPYSCCARPSGYNYLFHIAFD